MATNMKENGFETMIVKYLVENNHYEEGSNSDYNKIYAIDEVRLFRFLHDTQYEKLAELRIEDNEIEKKKFLDRLSKKISDDGVINIIRKGMKYKNKTVDFYMVRPSEGNQEAKESYDKNIFSVTRQLRYSNDYGRLALDVCIFLNGLPIITMELKNQITKQNHDDAIRQYMTDRTPDELLFQFKRCIVHFAVDDDEIYMCTELKKEKSFFMPFNKGNNNGAGNPRNPNGLKTDYLWKDILTKPCLSNILENYVQITEEKDEDTGRKSYKQIFPRYHQLSVVTSLLADAKNDGPGHRYLIQHSAGSGKSNSIAWLAHQLVTLKKDKKDVFDTVIVVTDRVNLDKQIRDTIKQFMQVSSTVGWAKDASTLSTLMEQGKKIIITIVHKFQFILDAVSADYKNKKFAIIIDEAHSSQNGSLAAKMNIAVSGNVYDDDDEFEDKLNTIIEGKKMAPNASYFAFTATPKNKTLEMFGKKMFDEHGNPILNDDGTQKANPHYVYTMKQAIEEKFILDVLRYYTPYESFYHIVKTVENDPLFDKKQAQRILRYYVEVQKVAVKEKAGVIVEHFHSEVHNKIGGENVRNYSVDSLMKNFSFVFQNVYLFEDTIANNIRFGQPEASMKLVMDAAKKACCHDFIMELPNGYDTVIGEGGTSLSGGEKQRISIARAIMKDAPVIILDEATANVDPENEKELMSAIEALTKEKTIIMIAHRLKTVEHADQILVLDKGQIVQQGRHSELLKQTGIYRKFILEREEAVGWKI